MSTFEQLITELTRDHRRVQPKDSLQFCANWFQSRLEEQRARTRDTLSSMSRPASFSHELPSDHYMDTTPSTGTISPFSQAPSRPRASIYDNGPSPFGTLNVPGNALLSPLDTPGASTNRGGFQFDDDDSTPQTALAPPALTNPFASFAEAPFAPASGEPGDFLHPYSTMIYARRTSVSAESIDVDGAHEEPLPYFPKSEEQLRRIKASITSNLIFRDLDEEQELGVLNAMQEQQVAAEEVVIRQGDVGEYFYVVERGLLHFYIRPDPLPPAWLTGEVDAAPASTPPGRFTQPGDHPIYGKKVAECRQGNSFGELALMYGHPRAATVLSIEPSTLWSLDRITFRTIILKAAHKRRTMYEHFLSSVPMLTSLEPGERSKIADALVSRVVADGEPVVRQGDMGDTLFFVEEGEAVITKEKIGEDGSAHEIEIGRYHKGDYFGELSLLRLAPRAATVTAVRRTDPAQPKLKVAGLDAQAFTRLLGPLREIMEREASEIYGPTYIIRR